MALPGASPGVYGPQGEAEKWTFIEELRGLAASRPTRWLILGDFNLIYCVADKNNRRLNRRLMGLFKGALDALRLRELRLNGRKFKWSNEQAIPTLTRIDRFFCTDGWDMLFPTAILHPLPSAILDHSPLLLVGSATFPRVWLFWFEAFWAKMDGFHEVVDVAWAKPVLSTIAIRRLHIKLSHVAKALKVWNRQNFSDLRMRIAIAKEIIGRLDKAQEERLLTDRERGLRITLRARIQGMASIIKIKIRQRARLSNIRLGDANSRLFHLRANGRRRKNYIVNLRTSTGITVTHEEKQEELRAHFQECLGTATPRMATLNWEELGYQARDLSVLEAPFGMSEVRTLQPLRDAPIRFRVSLYADDATIFVGPSPQGIIAITTILTCFDGATGLKTNLTKMEIFPVRCDEDQIAAAIHIFLAKQGSFPCIYLGLPLHFARLKVVSFQLLIDKIGARLAGWKGKHFTRAGRVGLARSVLSSMVTYYLTIFILPKWVLRRIDKIRRNFIWMKGTVDRARPTTPLSTGRQCAGPFPLEVLG
ncbi:hypothetical protein ACQ4PT_016861 [Festuca glaucescens]